MEENISKGYIGHTATLHGLNSFEGPVLIVFGDRQRYTHRSRSAAEVRIESLTFGVRCHSSRCGGGRSHRDIKRCSFFLLASSLGMRKFSRVCLQIRVYKACCQIKVLSGQSGTHSI